MIRNKRVSRDRQKDLYSCLIYENHKITKELYKMAFGIIRFLRNYKGHYKGSRFADKASREVMELFPYLLGCSYNQLFFKLKELTIQNTQGHENKI